jgi:hypothetical protein
MKLVRTANVAMLTDELAIEDDAGKRVVVAQPNCGYFSASMSSSTGDEVYRWRARLYVQSDAVAVAVETFLRNNTGETSSESWYVRAAAGSFASGLPAWATIPIDLAAGD